MVLQAAGRWSPVFARPDTGNRQLAGWRLLSGIVLVLLLCCWLPRAAVASDPKIPDLTGRVVDQAHVLDSGTMRRLSDDLASYEAQTSTQIVVVTIADMQGYTIEDWGLALLRGWHIGQASKNNGVVLVVAPNDRKLRIETGYGVEGTLPDATASVIIRQVMVPYFRRNDFAGGITAGVAAIKDALGGTFQADRATARPAAGPQGLTIAGATIPWMALVIIGIWGVMMVVGLMTRSGLLGNGRTYGSRRYDDWGNRGGFGGGSGGGGFGGGGFGGGGGSGGGGGASGGW